MLNQIVRYAAVAIFALANLIWPIAVIADTVSPAEAQQAFDLYNQHKYAEAARLFESIISRQPTARYCYYGALASQANRQQARATQLYQYVVTNYPKTQEAAYSRQALAVIGKSAPSAATASAKPTPASDELPESLKRLMPPEMLASLNTPQGKLAVQQMMHDKADEIATIRKAESAGLLPNDKIDAAVHAAPTGVAKSTESKGAYPFTAQDIARTGAHGIDQTRYPNCWFESSLAALSELPRGQVAIARMIRTLDKDRYLVRFADASEYVVTQADLGKTGITDNALWAAIIECAQIKKFPDNQGANGSDNDKSRLEVGLASITNGTSQVLYPGGANPSEVSSFIGGAVTAKNPIVAGTLAGFSDVPLVIPLHAYTVTGFDPSRNMITLRNPHGAKSRRFYLPDDPQHLEFEQLDDGMFKMSVSRFQKYFYSVARSNI